MDWLGEQIEVALRLVREGKSGTEIADELNERWKLDLTRSAVNGKLRRLGIRCMREQKFRKAPKLGAKAQPKPKKAIRMVPKLEPCCKGHTLIKLGSSQCRWVLNDPGRGRMDEALFCGQPKKWQSPYCHHHDKIAFTVRSHK